MFIAFLLILSAAKIYGESVDQDGLRKSRQLDLGLQDIRSDEASTPSRLPSSPKDNIINGYLPPVSSSPPLEFFSAQSQQALDFKSLNLVEKENECKPPFDNCNFKETFTSDSKIPKPSRDLVPPFNDLEQESAISSAKSKETKEEIKTTTQDRNEIITTTEKLDSKAFKKVSNVNNTFKFVTTTTAIRPKPVTNKAEATNELRSYLPPQAEFSAAAQTNVAFVQPANQNHDPSHDHHHGHHHGDNFNICEDAFHSFLCAPLKARKRITGALPESLKGQSSFLNYQKTLFNRDRETASSNIPKNEYLPPKSSSTNLIQPTYSPSSTAKKPVFTTISTTTSRPYSSPNIFSEPSNLNDKIYLPPGSANRIPSSSFVKPAFSNQQYSTVTSSTTSVPTALVKSSSALSPNSFFQKASPLQSSTDFGSPTAPVFSPLFSNGNNFYLPPNPNPVPSASFAPSFKNIFPVTSTLSPLPSASFSSNSKNNFLVASTLSPSPSTFAPLPTVSTFAPLPSNSIFASQKPKIQPTFPVFTTTSGPYISPSVIATTSKPFIQMSSLTSRPSNPINAYIPPKVSSPSTPSKTTIKSFSSTSNFSEQSSNTERSYLPPDLKEPAAAQISSAAVVSLQVKNPFHHGRDLCTDPFHSFLCLSAKPRKRITGQVPLEFKPDSSNIERLMLKPEPSSQDVNKVRPDKPLAVAPAQNLSYAYPKPVNLFSTPSNAVTVSTVPAPSTGYSYPKPDKIFPLPSQESVKFTTATSSNTIKPEPAPNPSEARVVSGYEYPKPGKIFPQPAGQENTKITTTSLPTTTTGYSYAQPQKPFPPPTDQKEVPQKIKQKTSSTSQPRASLPTNQVRGYQYPKPNQSLKLPEKKGYSYPKPEKRLELPNEGRFKFLLPQSNSNLDDLKNLGSADFIPVNKIEYKRAEPSKLLMGLRRFGERMKKRERQAQLLKRQLH